MLTGPSWALLRPNATACDFLRCCPILRRRRSVGRHARTDTRSFEGGVPYSVARKTGKAAMVGKIEGLGGNLGDIAWIDEAGLA